MGCWGDLEDPTARWWLRKVLKPFTGGSEGGIAVPVGGGLEQARGFSCGQAVLFGFVGKKHQRKL